jgi:TRAP-type C4-dicarboxylate transport system permease small subunit
MAWYDHQPFYWLLEKLTTRQIVNLIVGLFFIFLILGSYYVYLDTIESIRNNPLLLWVFRNVSILVLIVLIVFILLSWEVANKLDA